MIKNACRQTVIDILLLHRFATLFRYRKNHSKSSLQRQTRGIGMALRGSIRSFSQKDNQRVARPKRGRIRGTSAAEPKPQSTESTICDFVAVVGRATNSLRYGMYPLQWEGLEHGCPPPAGPSVPLPLHRVISCAWTLQPGQLGSQKWERSESKGVVLHGCAECGGPGDLQQARPRPRRCSDSGEGGAAS